MNTVRARGQGTKTRTGWQVCATVVEGNQKVKVYFTAKTLVLAQAKKDAYMAEYRGYAAPRSITLKDYANGWLTRIEARVKPGTYKHYKLTKGHIVNRLGEKVLSKLTPQMVEGALLDFPACTARNFKTVLGMILQDAMRDKLIIVNVARLARGPRYEPQESRILDRPTLSTILKHAPSEKMRTLWLFLSKTGVRPSEALNMIWPWLWEEGDGWWFALREAKTRAGKVPRPIASELMPLLKKIKCSVYVFATANGTPYSFRNVSADWAKACKDAGVGHYKMYELKKLCLSEIAANNPDEVTRQMGGHTDVRTTKQYYTRATMKAMREAVE